MRLAVITTHPIQYYAPLFRHLTQKIDVTVFFAHKPTAAQQGVGFGQSFEWDVDLTDGYHHVFLENVAEEAGGAQRYDTPGIGKALEEGGFDAVLTLGWHVKSQRQAIVAARRRGLPVMVRGDSQLGLQTNPVKLAVKRATYPLLLRTFAAALAVGQRNHDFYRHYFVPERQIFRSPHAVDNAFFKARATPEAAAALRARHGLSPSDTVVLFAGKLVPFKRPGDVIEAAARLSAPVHVMIAGSGELEGEVRADAERLGVPLTMLGFVNQSKMPAVYAAANVLVLPSTGRETWGLVANEALASGTPIVVSDACGSAPDLAADGTAGAVFPVDDVAALTATLTRLLASPPKPAAIAAKAAAHSLDEAASGVLRALGAVGGREGLGA